MKRADKHSARSRAVAADDGAYWLIGLTITAVVPALFWTGIVAVVSTAIGHPLSSATLVTVGAAIATFLFTAISALQRRAD